VPQIHGPNSKPNDFLRQVIQVHLEEPPERSSQEFVDNKMSNKTSNSPPHSVNVINYDEEEEEQQSFPLYDEEDQIKEVEVVDKEDNDTESFERKTDQITDLQRHASNFEGYQAAESIVVQDLQKSEQESVTEAKNVSP